MNIKTILKGMILFGFLGAECMAEESISCSKKNILFIVSDDCNWSLGCWGHPVVKTPNIDRLSRKGVRFKRANCQVSVCNPSRASFLTGLRPERTGVWDNAMNFRDIHPDLLTMPQYFRENGYWTGTVGKIFHHGERDPQSWNWCGDWRVDELRGTKGFSRNVTGGRLPWALYKEVESGELPDDRIAQLAVEKIGELDPDNPFFLAVGFIRPHDVFYAPKRFFDMYPLDSIQVDEKMAGQEIPRGAYGVSSWKDAYNVIEDKDKKELLRAYYACVSYMDEQVGKVLDALKESGLEKDTLVVFMGDHGYHNWEKNWWGKCTVWELSTRTPLIISGDGLPSQNFDCYRVVELLDLCPTLVEWAGLPKMPERDGRSLVPLLHNPDMPDACWRGEAFTQFGPNLRAIRTDRWRYCEWRGSQGGEALYDHSNDPDELVNLALNPEKKVVVKRLKLRMLDVLP